MAKPKPPPETLPGEVERVIVNPNGDPVFTARSTDGLWRCHAVLRLTTANRWIISSFQVAPWLETPSNGASTATARSLPFGRWLATIHDELVEMDAWVTEGQQPDGSPMVLLPGREDRARQLGDLARGASLIRGRAGYPRDHYRRIALEYLALQAQGVGRGIQKKLADQQDPPRQWQTIRDWLARATELGFLTPGTPGRAGRGPGPNLQEEESNGQ